MNAQTGSAGMGATKGWVRGLLALSLAINLAVAGLWAGGMLRQGQPSALGRDMGLGPVGYAISREDWRAMRPQFLARNPDLRAGPASLRRDFEPLLQALRAKPFVATDVEAAMEQLTLRNSERLASASAVIAAHLSAIDPEARAGFADRLEKVLRHGRGERAAPRPQGAAPGPELAP